VYSVEVLPTEDVPASADPARDLAFMLEGSQSAVWADQYECIDSVRRLVLHQPELVRPHLPGVFPFLVASAQSLRSSMARNALLCIKEALERGLPLGSDLEPLCSVTLQRMAGDKKFIGQACADALTAAVESEGEGLGLVVQGLLGSVHARNPEVSSLCMVYMERCLEAAARRQASMAPTTPKQKPPLAELLGTDDRTLVAALGRGYEGRLAVGKNASRRSLKRLRGLLGGAAFRALLNETLAPALAKEVLEQTTPTAQDLTAAAPAAVGANKAGGQGTFRDHIAALRTKMRTQQAQGGGGGEAAATEEGVSATGVSSEG
jgi:hypothetical protein